jgi:hypothetical protein
MPANRSHFMMFLPGGWRCGGSRLGERKDQQPSHDRRSYLAGGWPSTNWPRSARFPVSSQSWKRLDLRLTTRAIAARAERVSTHEIRKSESGTSCPQRTKCGAASHSSPQNRFSRLINTTALYSPTSERLNSWRSATQPGWNACPLSPAGRIRPDSST